MSHMLLPVLLTLAALMTGFAAFVVIDCSTPSFTIVGNDASRVCSTVDPLGTGARWIGVALAVTAVLGLFAIWWPVARRHHRLRQAEPTLVFSRNLARLADLSVGAVATRAEETPLLRLTRKLEAVEHAITADSVGAREATVQWMGLLREANDLHNRGLLATDDFKRINTQLLDLFSGSEQRGDLGPVPATGG